MKEQKYKIFDKVYGINKHNIYYFEIIGITYYDHEIIYSDKYGKEFESVSHDKSEIANMFKNMVADEITEAIREHEQNVKELEIQLQQKLDFYNLGISKIDKHFVDNIHHSEYLESWWNY